MGIESPEITEAPQERPIETPPDVAEKTTDQELVEISTAADSEISTFDSDRQENLKGALGTGLDLGFTQDELMQRLESSGTINALGAVKAKAHEAYRGLKKILTVGVGALALGQSAEARPAEYFQELKPQQKQEQVVEQAQQKETEETPELSFLATAGDRPEITKLLRSDKFKNAKDPESIHTLFEEIEKSGNENEKLALGIVFRKFIGEEGENLEKILAEQDPAMTERLSYEAGTSMFRGIERLYRQKITESPIEENVRIQLENDLKLSSWALRAGMSSGRQAESRGDKRFEGYEKRTLAEMANVNDTIIRIANTNSMFGGEDERMMAARLRSEVIENAGYMVRSEKRFTIIGKGKFLFGLTADLRETLYNLGIEDNKDSKTAGLTIPAWTAATFIAERLEKQRDLIGEREAEIMGSILEFMKRDEKGQLAKDSRPLVFATPISAPHELQHHQFESDDALFAHWVKEWNALPPEDKRKFISQAKHSVLFKNEQERESFVDKMLNSPIDSAQIMKIRKLEREGALKDLDKEELIQLNLISEFFAYSTDNLTSGYYNPKYEIKHDFKK